MFPHFPSTLAHTCSLHPIMEEASTPIVAQRALARGVIGNGGLVNDPTTSSSGDRGSSPDLTGKLPLPIGAIVGAGSSGEGGTGGGGGGSGAGKPPRLGGGGVIRGFEVRGAGIETVTDVHTFSMFTLAWCSAGSQELLLSPL